MNQEYNENGYVIIRRLFAKDELRELTNIICEFHENWKRKNSGFYLEKAVNSACITGSEHLTDEKRNAIFKFIASFKLMKIVADVLPDGPAFMNTQLFFNPVNAGQKNYWHRDSQYHMTVAEQQEALSGPDIVHFRIALANEPGVELVPGTHRRWDTHEELDIRLERNGHKNYENLSTGLQIKLELGDLLVFSANMIHRGLYGMERLALDIIFCDAEPDLIKFASEDCFPSRKVLSCLDEPAAFLTSINLKSQ